jgi:ectoine hydroxylase-related dioxygenase (phytanoyl-CoA dioxygenase family)
MATYFDPQQPALLPSDDDIDFYQLHGFYVSRVIVPGPVLDEALRGMERFYAGERDAPFPGPPGAAEQGWQPADGDVLRKNDYASLQVHELARLVAYPTIGAVAARLSRTPLIRLWHDQLLYKPTDRPDRPANVGWHTDRQYWRTCTSDSMITAWIPFHDVDESTGSITFLVGSQRWSTNASELDFFNHDLDGLERRLRDDGHAVVKKAVTLKRGQVSFHHCRTVHGSGPNHGALPRRSIAIHMQTTDNRHQLARDRDGQVLEHPNDRLCRPVNGAPDYTDPDLFPVLWDEAAATGRGLAAVGRQGGAYLLRHQDR